jgi:hemolysin activation/secretion protein
LSLGVIALVAVIPNAPAQQLPVGAGQIQQVPPAPALERPSPELPIPQQETPPPRPEAAGPKFPVKALRVTGQTRFSEAELLAATNFQPGSELGLADLRALAAKITDFYNQRGYFVAQAYLPAQDITDGAVTIAVIEGRYGEISLHNESHVRDGLVTSILGGLNSGDPVESAPLERRLLIISDIPGVQAKSTMSPGAAVGTSDLKIDLAAANRVNGSVEADNWGDPHTGAYRLGATVNVNNILGYGDVLSVRTLDSTTGGMFYGRLSYQAQIQDATVGVAYTAYKYRLGQQFSVLDATGTEQIVSVYGSYPLIRSRNSNLYALVDFDYRIFQDKVGATSSVVDRAAAVVTVGLNGDSHDMFGGGGWNTYYIGATVGSLSIQTPLARQLDALTAHTNGGYGKISGSVSRLQNVYGPLSIYASVRGQYAFQNLDISEKMELGGALAVRAYPEGEAYGDQGYVSTLEARLLLPKWLPNVPGQVQLISFVDTGYVQLSHSPWFSGPNTAFRSGVGIGASWFETNNFIVSVGLAHRLGAQKATSSRDQWGRVWVQAIKFF